MRTLDNLLEIRRRRDSFVRPPNDQNIYFWVLASVQFTENGSFGWLTAVADAKTDLITNMMQPGAYDFLERAMLKTVVHSLASQRPEMEILTVNILDFEIA